MKKRYSVLLVISILLVILGLQYLVFLNTRHHLLCEVLQPGMPESEVIAILEQAGDFTMNRAEWGGGYIILGVGFRDIKGRFLYGSFKVMFDDYKYKGAFTQIGSDIASTNHICDFIDTIPSATPP